MKKPFTKRLIREKINAIQQPLGGISLLVYAQDKTVSETMSGTSIGTYAYGNHFTCLSKKTTYSNPIL